MHMQIYFINNVGAGLSDYITVKSGITVNELFTDKMPGKDFADYVITVDSTSKAGNEIILADQRVTITHAKLKGA